MDSFYQTLTNELANPVYAGMTDLEAVNKLNTKDVPARQLVPLWMVKKHAIENGYWIAIKAAATSHESPTVQAAATLTLDYVEDKRFDNLDLDLSSTQSLLAALVSGGVITQTNADELDAMADTFISKADELGLGVVGDGHVLSARELLAEE